MAAPQEPPADDPPATCHCIFNHPVTEEERARLAEELAYARRIR